MQQYKLKKMPATPFPGLKFAFALRGSKGYTVALIMNILLVE